MHVRAFSRSVACDIRACLFLATLSPFKYAGILLGVYISRLVFHDGCVGRCKHHAGGILTEGGGGGSGSGHGLHGGSCGGMLDGWDGDGCRGLSVGDLKLLLVGLVDGGSCSGSCSGGGDDGSIRCRRLCGGLGRGLSCDGM